MPFSLYLICHKTQKTKKNIFSGQLSWLTFAVDVKTCHISFSVSSELIIVSSYIEADSLINDVISAEALTL